MEATEWCAPIVVAPKNSDNICKCVDLSHLNRFVVRERYQSLIPAHAVADITASDAKYFTVIDALKGYYQCPLDQHSQPLTTFITPFGRFKCHRDPYGISSISEHYNRQMTEAFKGLSGLRHVVDDFVIYDGNITYHIAHVKQFLQHCADKHIALNAEKCSFFQTQTSLLVLALQPRLPDRPIHHRSHLKVPCPNQQHRTLLLHQSSEPVVLQHKCSCNPLDTIQTSVKHQE